MDPLGLGFDPESASQVARAVVPYVVTAVKSVGARVWSRTEDAAVEEAAGWGRRLAQRIRGAGDSPQAAAVVDAVDDVVADPDNEDTHAALRVKVGKALAESPQLLTEVVALLRQATGSVSGGIVVTGDRSVGSAGGLVITGDNNRVGGTALS
ncbi:hypothetical protein GCM10010168_21840 [Actinoplanes ianthinogenes]|uniref:Uncharacterized protein n=1 Tax=Actinoplanes ianthinogenes TaxID=122358 RepID=A0ABM7M865_9ACTN|nr:hypothetical protein [Actinoplanes ianthinogenes]BCJ47825.1 hypothetical protein Aiant_84820 [Actinoplanes ianthinogenes]GGR04429.1 hypothetical protein GCM10010168_21840 [Actinoplanes ianthinogenes]